MSPRPRKVSDADVFAAVARAMARVGPDQLTLARIADVAGVTAGALVQRFGSREALLHGFAAAAAAAAPDRFAAFRNRWRSPARALVEHALCHADLAPSADVLCRNLAYLHNDLTDPVLRQHLVRSARAMRRGLEALARDAVDAGEVVRGTDPSWLARRVETAVSGSLMNWAIWRHGPARRWLADDVRAALAPHLTAAGRRAVRPAR